MNFEKKETILDLLNFQLTYLNQLVENIPEERLYEKQLEGYNSAGWILGHLCVEVEDIIQQLEDQEPFLKLAPNWEKWFRNKPGKINELTDLPSKKILIRTLNHQYNALGTVYAQLSPIQRSAKHPSLFLREVLSTYDAWFAHHLTIHIAMHCGNIVVWKKMIGIPVNGF